MVKSTTGKDTSAEFVVTVSKCIREEGLGTLWADEDKALPGTRSRGCHIFEDALGTRRLVKLCICSQRLLHDLRTLTTSTGLVLHSLHRHDTLVGPVRCNVILPGTTSGLPSGRFGSGFNQLPGKICAFAAARVSRRAASAELVFARKRCKGRPFTSVVSQGANEKGNRYGSHEASCNLLPATAPSVSQDVSIPALPFTRQQMLESP